LPLIAWHWQVVQPWSAPASLVLTPVLAAVLTLGVVTVVGVALFSSDGPWAPLLNLLDRCLDTLVAGARWWSELPGASMVAAMPPWWWCLAWAGLFIPLRTRLDILTRMAAAAILLAWLLGSAPG
jgi:hypothetical protein